MTDLRLNAKGVKVSSTVIVVRFSDGFVATMEGSYASSVVEVIIDDTTVFSNSNLGERIHSLALDTRTFQCLRRAGITTIEELVLRSDHDLLNITNFGPTCLKEVATKLAKIGLKLSPTNFAGARPR